MVPELATELFLLQPIQPEDQPFIFEGLSHPDVIPFYGVQYKTLEETRAQMQYYSQLLKEGVGMWWKIVDREDGVKKGAIGFNNYSAQHNKCEVGYWLLPRYWGQGIITEVFQKVIQFLFEEKGMHRIEALIEEGNEMSRRVALKAGFTLEGTLRDYEKKSDRYISLHMYSLLASDLKT